jgi:preprotein translocase subunit SecE
MVTPQVQTVGAGADRVKLSIAVVLLVASFAAYYWLAAKGVWVQWGALLGCLLLALVAFFTATQGKALVAFGRDAQREVKKVVWPERKEALQMTAYVFGFVLLMAVFLWLTDKTLEWLFYDLILGWRK